MFSGDSRRGRMEEMGRGSRRAVIAYILVHQTGLADAAVTEDDDLVVQVSFWPQIRVHSMRALSCRTFKRTFFLADMMMDWWCCVGYLFQNKRLGARANGELCGRRCNTLYWIADRLRIFRVGSSPAGRQRSSGWCKGWLDIGWEVEAGGWLRPRSNSTYRSQLSQAVAGRSAARPTAAIAVNSQPSVPKAQSLFLLILTHFGLAACIQWRGASRVGL